MVGECTSAGLPEPSIEEYAGGMKIVFFPGQAKEAIAVSEGKTRGKTKEKTREKTREKILRFLGENPRITQAELVQRTGLSRGGVEWHLKNLKAKGILRRVGPAKGGHWEVLKNGV